MCVYLAVCVCAEFGGWFHLPYPSGTWREAQLYCRERYTDLTSIQNPSDLSLVSSFHPDTDYIWLGLSGDTWYWSDQSSSLFRYWGSGQPLNMNLNYSNCVVMDMSPSGMWSNVACDNKLPFICYRGQYLLMLQGQHLFSYSTFYRYLIVLFILPILVLYI